MLKVTIKRSIYSLSSFLIILSLLLITSALLLPTFKLTYGEFVPHLFLLLIAAVSLFYSPHAGIVVSLFASLIFYYFSYLLGTPKATSALEQSLFLLIFGISLSVLLAYKTKRFRALARELRHAKTLLDLSLHPILLKDKNGLIRYASSTTQNIAGLVPKKLIGTDLKSLIHPEDLDSFNTFFRNIQKSSSTIEHTEFRLKNRSGGWTWVRNDASNLLHHPDIGYILTSIQNISLQKSLDEQRLQSLKRARVAKRIAENAVRARDEFLSVASHELKTPLTTVLLHLQKTIKQLLTQSLADFDGAKFLDSLKIVEAQGHRLSFMIKDLLNISLISTGRIELVKQPLKLAPLIKQVAERMTKEAKVPLHLDILHPLTGEWDPVRLEQIFTNLISNAIKYGEGKKIEINIWESENTAYVSVKNFGRTIPPHEQNKIFELFTRGHKNNKEGLGVGLYISRQIAKSHGGNLIVSSTEQHGTIFTLSLPR